MIHGRIGRFSALGGLVVAAAALPPAGPPPVQPAAGCQVVQVARGRLTPVVTVNGTSVTLTLRFFPPVTFEREIAHGPRAGCDRAMGPSTVRDQDASEVLRLVDSILYEEAAKRYKDAAAQSTDFAFRDLGNIALILKSQASGAFFGPVEQASRQVIEAFLEPTPMLTDAGALLVAQTVVAWALDAHLRGIDLQAGLNTVLGQVAAKLQGRPALTTSTSTGSALEQELADHVLRILAEFRKMVIVPQRPTHVIDFLATGGQDDCEHALDVWWNFFGGTFKAVLDIRCGQIPATDHVARVTVTVPPPQPPGGGGAVSIVAFNQLGTPFPLDQAEVEGLAEVMPDGSGEPKAVINGATATFNFTVGNPRRDGDFPLDLRIWTTPSSGRFSARARATVSVYNVSPEILDVTPDTLAGAPGETIAFADSRILLKDENADRFNGFEVTATSLKLNHPAGLNTGPRFDAADFRHFVSHDPTSGRYVFAFARSATVALPHPHGTWVGRLEMSDDNGNAATAPLTYIIRDVPPRFAASAVTPQWVHTQDGKAIAVSLTVEDPNGVDDILDVTLDATAAGGGRYSLGRGLTITRRTPLGYVLDLDPPFPHTDAAGFHSLRWTVSDETGTVRDTSFIHVGNDPPIIHGYGYLFGPDSIRAGEDSLHFIEVPPARLCPLQHLSAGIVASDPEKDRFTVEGVIIETGQRVQFEHTRGRIFIAYFDAPNTPGHYTLKVSVTEVPPENTTSINLPIEVVPCDSAQRRQREQQFQVMQRLLPEDGEPQEQMQQQQQEIELADPATAEDVAAAPADPAGQKQFAAGPGGVVQPVSMAPTQGQGGPRVEALADSIALVLAGLAGPDAPPLESYLLATGGSTGPVGQLFAINRSGRPLRLPAATMVVEPVAITPAIQARVRDLLQRYLAAGGKGLTLEMYCLERLRLPPAGGTILRIVSGGAAAPFRPFAGILDAASRVRDRLELHPDSDPTEYFHAIRQWALWSAEERLDAEGFAKAFVETSRRNIEAGGQPWTSALERDVRGLIANRWNDVRSVLREAGFSPR